MEPSTWYTSTKGPPESWEQITDEMILIHAQIPS
jgi:hypothetical protein